MGLANMEGRSVKTNQALTWTHTALCRQEKIQVLTVWHEMAVRVIDAKPPD